MPSVSGFKMCWKQLHQLRIVVAVQKHEDQFAEQVARLSAADAWRDIIPAAFLWSLSCKILTSGSLACFTIQIWCSLTIDFDWCAFVWCVTSVSFVGWTRSLGAAVVMPPVAIRGRRTSGRRTVTWRRGESLDEGRRMLPWDATSESVSGPMLRKRMRILLDLWSILSPVPVD